MMKWKKFANCISTPTCREHKSPMTAKFNYGLQAGFGWYVYKIYITSIVCIFILTCGKILECTACLQLYSNRYQTLKKNAEISKAGGQFICSEFGIYKVDLSGCVLGSRPVPKTLPKITKQWWTKLIAESQDICPIAQPHLSLNKSASHLMILT